MLNWLPEAASSYAGRIDYLLILITVIVGAWFLLAEGLLIYMAIRFRRREGRTAAYLPARSLKAMSWILVPCGVILMFDLVIDAAGAPVWADIKERIPPHEELVRIQGERWIWRFTYAGPDKQLDTADDFETLNDLRVPVNTVVQFDLRSKDVLHSFWVPALRLKQDAVPGRSIRGWFEPILEGSYEVVCTEICGVGHTMMKGAMQVLSREEYDQWVQTQLAAARASQGGASE